MRVNYSDATLLLGGILLGCLYGLISGMVIGWWLAPIVVAIGGAFFLWMIHTLRRLDDLPKCNDDFEDDHVGTVCALVRQMVDDDRSLGAILDGLSNNEINWLTRRMVSKTLKAEDAIASKVTTWI
ncbi:hypothetical protein UFOVP1518_53 [uncultured Caudovirales phage]|uniref:Uncharacterized protein n=1 Tax=uncultured Caudovirales phage TaxID=2100421 RepID=A0A6J5PD95_9CAUD|nr:hypothetical protein UFOVP475_66 [uncultured Caudovirales phage]CAB4169433.1 hypothetical protein UFOVP897_28 [uncultured Caudovirales phage]CAB4175891.1 hypothetical protein UFOVP984_66 [uncultured Caudovirales phage]CAB4181008.1 hypothetical protein UFOVP1072_7 [uncultured Caudovirales phage]CAB4191635.1 hypothetical protein UFOVP1211_65 [uncultured Caudovirales phage]